MRGQVGEMVEDDDQAGVVANSINSVGQAGAGGGVRKGGHAAGGAAAGQGKKQEEEEDLVAEEEEEEEEVFEEPDEETLGKMSSMEQRLFKIRLKMNKVWLGDRSPTPCWWWLSSPRRL